MENKKYLFLEVGGRNCQVMTNDNICVLDGDCASCPHGNTLNELAEQIEKLLPNIVEEQATWGQVAYKNEAQRIIKALLGGEEK